MYKVIIEVPGKLWVVVNTRNIKDRHEFTAKVLADNFCLALNG